MGEYSDMNGLWSGWYAYSMLSQRVPFTAWMDDTTGLLTGTILEPNTFSDMDLDDLQSEIAGTRNGSHVFFSKTYLSGQGAHAFPIAYDGHADAEFLCIRGEWSFSGVFKGHRGPFEMRRASQGISEGILRDVLAPVER
ncbi:MAG: hypothetical protein MRY64_05470 [Hyphomonadaceae bacterium]|nr:hypothetical protein [Hyphomonadaceae bacterium]